MTEPGSESGARGDVSSPTGENKKQMWKKNLEFTRVTSRIEGCARGRSEQDVLSMNLCFKRSTLDRPKNKFRRQNVKNKDIQDVSHCGLIYII